MIEFNYRKVYMAKTNLKEDKKEEIDLTKVKEELTDYIDLQIKKSLCYQFN